MRVHDDVAPNQLRGAEAPLPDALDNELERENDENGHGQPGKVAEIRDGALEYLTFNPSNPAKYPGHSRGTT